MSRPLAGILGPVVSTFDADTGELAPIPFRANIRAHLAAGLAGVVTAGSTGEAVLLDERERHHLVEWARSLVPGDRWLIAGAGAESTRQAIQRARDVADRGADAVLVVSPHYYGAAMTAEALAGYFRHVADASPVPVILYNIPKYTHLTLEPGLVAALATHGNIIGIKDSSGDLKLLGMYLEAQSPTFSVLTGSGSGLYSALEMGSRGGVLAVALFAAPLAMRVWNAFHHGDPGGSGQAQERLVPLAKTIVARLGVAGVKAALDGVGLAGGPPRLPLLSLERAEREQVSTLLRGAGLLRAA